MRFVAAMLWLFIVVLCAAIALAIVVLICAHAKGCSVHFTLDIKVP